MKNLLSRRYIGAPALLWIILASVSVSVAYVLPLDPLTPYGSSGGDEHFYLDRGYTLVTDQPLPGVDISVLSQPPRTSSSSAQRGRCSGGGGRRDRRPPHSSAHADYRRLLCLSPDVAHRG
ncbi:MAG: hypothetical protein IPK17_38200 [Chloroflexi bacterium]|uniref:hypothetical protein n=1 Tax=Candidatus Flexifilum breve TaxID=3140694 RepID=UPI003136F88E|nr:hypothetical protein [Chloroflexota bacterium]